MYLVTTVDDNYKVKWTKKSAYKYHIIIYLKLGRYTVHIPNSLFAYLGKYF